MTTPPLPLVTATYTPSFDVVTADDRHIIAATRNDRKVFLLEFKDGKYKFVKEKYAVAGKLYDLENGMVPGSNSILPRFVKIPPRVGNFYRLYYVVRAESLGADFQLTYIDLPWLTFAR